VNIEVAVDAFCVLYGKWTPGLTSSLHNNTDVCANVCVFYVFFLLPVLLYELHINKKNNSRLIVSNAIVQTALPLWLSGARTVR